MTSINLPVIRSGRAGLIAMMRVDFVVPCLQTTRLEACFCCCCCCWKRKKNRWTRAVVTWFTGQLRGGGDKRTQPAYTLYRRKHLSFGVFGVSFLSPSLVCVRALRLYFFRPGLIDISCSGLPSGLQFDSRMNRWTRSRHATGNTSL